MTETTSLQNFSIRVFFKTMFTIALPIALQNLLTTTASMVDTIMIGSEGELAVAAVGICSQISSLFFSCYFGFAGGALLFFAQYWGAKNIEGVNRTFGLSLTFMFIVSLLFGGFAVIKPEFLLSVYTDKAILIEIAIPYIRIVGFSFPLLVCSVIMSFLLRTTERVKVPLFCSIVGLVVNFVLNWILIYGRLGFPKMGPAGAAVGTLASSVCNFVLLLFFLLRDRETFTFHFHQIFSWGNGFVFTYLKKCFPILCNELFYGVGQMLINIVIGHQDESAIAAMAAFRVLEGFVFAFFGGLADAASVVVGKDVGAGNHKSAYNYAKGFAVLCPLITFVICLIFVFLNRPLLSLFGLGETALFYGKYMLIIYLFAGTIRTCNYIMNTCYRAGGDPVYGTVLEISCLYVISVPATWIAGMVLNLPFLAVFAFVYTDEILRLIFETCRTRSCKWIKPVTPQGVEALPAFMAERKKKARKVSIASKL